MLLTVTSIFSLGGDKKIEGEAVYCLSLAYDFAGEQERALSVSIL